MSNNTPNIEQLTSLVTSLQSQIDQINSGNIAGTNILSMSQKLDNINDLTIPSLRDNINSAQNTQDNLSKSHTNFQNRLDNHKNNLSDLQNQIQGASANHNTLANNINNLNNQHNDLNNKVLNTSNNNQNLQNNVNNINSSHQNISSEIQNLKYQMQNFNTKLETITPTDSQHSQLMSKIDNLSNTLTPIMVKTQVAQQTSNNLYAQLQPLSQTVNNQTAQIHANSSGILQNAAQSASNFGAFYGMGDDGDGSTQVLLDRGGGGGSSTTPNPAGGDGSSTTPNPSGGDGSSTTPAPSVKSVTPAEQLEITLKFRKDFINDQSTSMPDGVNDLSYLGIAFDQGDITDQSIAIAAGIPECKSIMYDGAYSKFRKGYVVVSDGSVSDCNSPGQVCEATAKWVYGYSPTTANCQFVWDKPPKWIKTCKTKEAYVYDAQAPTLLEPAIPAGWLIPYRPPVPYGGWIPPSIFGGGKTGSSGWTPAGYHVHNRDVNKDVYCYVAPAPITDHLKWDSFDGKDMNTWNVNYVTDMSGMLKNATSFIEDIGNWNTSNVKNMSNMFYNASSFNKNIGGWDVSNVTKMSFMFYDTSNYNNNFQDLKGWNVSSVTEMISMFDGASVFNQDISTWDVSNVNNMSSMFRNTSLFNQNISSWDVSNVKDMRNMFNDASAFNQPIGNWNIIKVTNMSYMLALTNNAPVFYQDLSKWGQNITVKTDSNGNLAKGASPFLDTIVDKQYRNFTGGNILLMNGYQNTSFMDNILKNQTGYQAGQGDSDIQGKLAKLPPGLTAYEISMLANIAFANFDTGESAAAGTETYYLANNKNLRGFKGTVAWSQ